MYYQKPCLFNTTLLEWVTKCNTSFPQLPQMHIIQGLCEEKPSSIWCLIHCNRHRINAHLFFKQLPKVRASRGRVGGGGVLALEVFWVHSDRILASSILLRLAAILSPSPSHFIREEPWGQGWIWPISVKQWKPVCIHICVRVSFHFYFYFLSANKTMLRHNIKTWSGRALFHTPLV